MVYQQQLHVAHRQVHVGRIHDGGIHLELQALSRAAHHIDTGDGSGLLRESLKTQETTVHVELDTVEQDTAHRRVGERLGLATQLLRVRPDKGELLLEELELLLRLVRLVRNEHGRGLQREVQRASGLPRLHHLQLSGALGNDTTYAGNVLGARGVVNADRILRIGDVEREAERQAELRGKAVARGLGRVRVATRRVGEVELLNHDLLDRVDRLGRDQRDPDVEHFYPEIQPPSRRAAAERDETGTLGERGDGIRINVMGKDVTERV